MFLRKDNKKFLIKNIDLSKGTWIKDLKETTLIDEDCLHYLRINISNGDKVTQLVDYMVAQNNVEIYISFIKIWKKIDQAKATQFEECINKKKNDQGL